MGKQYYTNKGSKDNIIISIAGAHGVGKTTIFNLLKNFLGENNKFKFFPERYKKIPPFPFGSENKQIAFRSEIHFLQQLIRRNKNITNFDNRYNGRVIILDRTSLCVLVYSKSLYLKEKDYNLILDMYKSVKWKENYIIYLTAQPDTILKRIIQRGSIDKIRKEWNEDDKKYLLEILSYYNQFLFSKNQTKKVFTLDTDKLISEEVVEEIKRIITDTSGYSFNKFDNAPSTQKNLNDFV
ncbi:MAG: deoxynucleoside kinase [Candidatus Lokiarchaeota archaeon]|nr:deoxynucleoside kinase [Candidatus Lokiarchaeota archaeon]